MILIGNKTDLEDKRAISTKDAENYATEKGFLFQEVSAKTGDGIEELFTSKIFSEMARKFKIGNLDEEGSAQEINQNGIKLEEDQQNIKNDINIKL